VVPLAAVDVTAVVDAAKRLLDAEALTPGAVGARLAEQWPDTPAGSFLAAFGPASATDVQTWSGLSRLGEVLEQLKLMRIKGEAGQTLYDIPDASGKNGVFPGTVLVDGFVAGSWELVGKGESTSLWVQPYVRLGDEALDEVTGGGKSLAGVRLWSDSASGGDYGLGSSRFRRVNRTIARTTPRNA
jgi:Winged helix DNA-binding domain